MSIDKLNGAAWYAFRAGVEQEREIHWRDKAIAAKEDGLAPYWAIQYGDWADDCHKNFERYLKLALDG